jgi:hypothetical protein
LMTTSRCEIVIFSPTLIEKDLSRSQKLAVARTIVVRSTFRIAATSLTVLPSLRSSRACAPALHRDSAFYQTSHLGTATCEYGRPMAATASNSGNARLKWASTPWSSPTATAHSCCFGNRPKPFVVARITRPGAASALSLIHDRWHGLRTPATRGQDA